MSPVADDMMPRNSIEAESGARRSIPRHAVGLLFLALMLGLPTEARASLLSPALEDKLATFLALFVIFVVPVVLIALFWMVHILPEKIAHKRHHPQFEAIRTLCLLSLVFGGLLWPIAWLWAYSKPVMYKLAYGTDKHPDAHTGGEAWDEGAVTSATLRQRVARLEERVPASELEILRADLDALEARFARDDVR
jgi:CBS domain containing-hemolysin-like protein